MGFMAGPRLRKFLDPHVPDPPVQGPELGPGLGPWPLQCMHKSVVHAQESCAYTRILCMHKNLNILD